MHKNTLIFTAILAVIAALVVGVNIGKSLSSTSKEIIIPTIVPTPTTKPITLLLYQSDRCGISFQIPSNLKELESTTSGTLFTDSTKPEDSIILICQKEIPRVPLSADKIEMLTISSASTSATISATLYHDASEKDGTRIDKLIFYNKQKNIDVLIAGFGKIYEDVIASIKLE